MLFEFKCSRISLKKHATEISISTLHHFDTQKKYLSAEGKRLVHVKKSVLRKKVKNMDS